MYHIYWFQSSVSLSMRGSFGVYCVTYPFFSCFEQLYLCFTQFGSSAHCLNFVKFQDSSFKKVQSQKGTFSCAMKGYITARQLESHCRAVFQDCHSPDMIHYQRWSQHLMLSETFVSLPYNKLFHFDIFVKQKQKAYSCFSLLNQWKNLCQLIAWILSNSNCL